MSFFGSTNTNQIRNDNFDDHRVAGSPTAVSKLRFSPIGRNLACASQDALVRIQSVMQNSANAQAELKCGSPSLDVAQTSDGKQLFAACTDKTVKFQDPTSNQNQVVAQHSAPVKCIEQANDINCLISGSQDETLKYTDIRTQKEVGTVKVDERVQSMDYIFPMVIIAQPDRKVLVFDVRNPQQPAFSCLTAPLRMQTRCIALFTKNTNGFAAGSIEGRVRIHVFNDEKNSFSYKCHRVASTDKKDLDLVYPVNGIRFNKLYGTFATIGGDGTYTFWDKDARHRLLASKNVELPLISCDFSSDDTLFAYAAGNDWSQGAHFQKNKNSEIFIHFVKDNEIKNRAINNYSGRK